MSVSRNPCPLPVGFGPAIIWIAPEKQALLERALESFGGGPTKLKGLPAPEDLLTERLAALPAMRI